MSKLSRRRFLAVSGGALTGGPLFGAVALVDQQNTSGCASALAYPLAPVCTIDRLSVNQPLAFHYPDPGSPCVALKLGRPFAGGVGPDSDIVAFSILCPHMGCGLSYDTESRCFKCPCHFSIFDAEGNGRQICGQATHDLARIRLEYDDTNTAITATGVDGTLYGRRQTLGLAEVLS